ncbi:hypothetical protein jhhlp_007274 [Lomentospora prolificans]|uniref:Uncharacterized protein n=1 Tax=Lomentospora prolificans TaxID=41688 RepID=A0A2N3N266_9PEZI|nr:hypothetical protein jhhlp_007274 [Lomentospora prolificans]
MSALHSGAATLPRGFRYHHPGFPEPRTPEPLATTDSEARPPSPPRPKFRLKRRNASQLTAPTQQFLASVAAADVPIPSIEVPDLGEPTDSSQIVPFPPLPRLSIPADRVNHQRLRANTFSPPKTPAPDAIASLSPRRYPDWTIDSILSSSESSPECESSRPSTARSTHTSVSLFSRISLASDEAHCISPEYEGASFNTFNQATDEIADAAPARSAGRMRKAPWTKAMSEHLWSTYLMYCQDPKVTPFRTGRNGIPPHGVCVRVAREAKRSWKGSRPLLTVEQKSGSNTPTAESPNAYIQWPHTCSATRARLRELCRMRTASSTARTHQYLSHSPTPFGRTITRHWNRKSTPFRSPSVFCARDMNMSLALSTADSMQPSGPLAQLTSSALEPVQPDILASESPAEAPELTLELPEGLRNRLGSPFTATSRSYGPSSSNTLAAGFSFRSSMPQRQTSTLEPRRGGLQSPARLTRSRSNTLQKRRSRQAANELRKGKRPSLGSDLWTAPGFAGDSLLVGEGSAARPELEFSSTSSGQRDDLFVPRTNIEELLAAAGPCTLNDPKVSLPGSSGSLAPSTSQPPRLGSPFAASSASLSFPNRLSQPQDLLFGAIRRPFATIQQPTNEGDTTAKANLASRLTYINERLREFRQRDQDQTRPESPF